MKKEEYIKKAEEILVSYHDNYCQTEGCKDCRKYRKLILQALYQLHLEGVREAYEKGLRDMADDETIANKAIAKFRTEGKA